MFLQKAAIFMEGALLKKENIYVEGAFRYFTKFRTYNLNYFATFRGISQENFGKISQSYTMISKIVKIR
jgi:hypothetical protein